MCEQTETIDVLNRLFKHKIDMETAAELLSISLNELNRKIDNYVYKSDATDEKEVNKPMSDNWRHMSYRTIMSTDSPVIKMSGIRNEFDGLMLFEAGENLSDGDHIDIIDYKGYKAKMKTFSSSPVKMCIDDVKIGKIGNYVIVDMWSN